MIKIFTSKTQKIGEKGEDFAVVFLMKQGFEVVERNFHSRNGEIDIIAKKGEITYFFEVKTGKSGNWFNPADNLTYEKLKKFIKAASYYVLKNKIQDYRIQAILVRISYGVYTETKCEIIDIT